MPKNTKTGKVGKERLDKYYHLAKEQGYRSRAAFKLIQLNKKYDFLSSAKAVVDLCAAPGGWLQVARKYQPMAGLTVGVDLANIKSIPGVTTFVGDITTQKCLTRIRQELGGLKADVVMHDGSPNVGANWFKDAYTQAELVLHALKLAAHCLRPGGFFVSKVFRSKDYTSIVWVHNQFFEKVEATKPKASRHTSAEIYLVCSGYKAPKEIDPKLFNPTYVFEDISENKTLRSLAPKELAKRANRNREGYEDDLFLLFKRFSVAEFVESQKPISILAEYNELHFDEKSQKYFTHPDTSDEIKRLCADLKVLGMADMKAVLKWREKMAKFNDGQEMNEDDEEEEAEETTTTKAPVPEESEVDIAKLKKELEELRDKTDKVKKNLIKRQKIKVAKRMPLPSDMTERKDDILDNLGDAMLFSLSGVASKEALAQAVSEEAGEDFDDDAEEQVALAEEAAKNKSRKSAISVEYDDDEDEEEKYDQLVEQGIESLYKQYLQRKTRKEKKLLKLLESKERAKADDLNEELHEQKKFEYQATSNPLLVDFDQKKTPAERKAQQWFSQNVFDVLKNVDEENKPKKKKEDKPAAKRQRTEAGKIARGGDSDDDDSDEDHDNSDDDDSDDEDYQALKKKMAASTIGEGAASGSGEGDIEFIPKELHDEDTRATSLALATKLLQKKARKDFVDSAFSRWAFNEDNLPDWLSAEEKKSYEKQLPITKEEVEKIKAKYKELNDRPVKKVLEAIYRKKRRVQMKMEKVREKANVIAESQDLSNQDKAIQLKKLYKDAQASVKPRKVYVVARKFKAGRSGGKMAGGSVVKYVDSRMKKEKMKTKKEAKKRKRGA